MKKIALLIIMIPLLVGCTLLEILIGTEYGIFMRNDTNKTIEVWGTYNKAMGTKLPDKRPAAISISPSINNSISPYDFIMSQGHDWTKSLSNTDTIRVFVFDSETYQETDWSVICDQYLILQRYDLTKAELEVLGWRIAYPPTPEMKDIKMWPSYEEAIKNAESLKP